MILCCHAAGPVLLQPKGVESPCPGPQKQELSDPAQRTRKMKRALMGACLVAAADAPVALLIGVPHVYPPPAVPRGQPSGRRSRPIQRIALAAVPVHVPACNTTVIHVFCRTTDVRRSASKTQEADAADPVQCTAQSPLRRCSGFASIDLILVSIQRASDWIGFRSLTCRAASLTHLIHVGQPE